MNFENVSDEARERNSKELEESALWPTSSTKTESEDWESITAEDAETIARLHAQAQPKQEPLRPTVDRSYEDFL